jgi:hypothetical protein
MIHNKIGSLPQIFLIAILTTKKKSYCYNKTLPSYNNFPVQPKISVTTL